MVTIGNFENEAQASAYVASMFLNDYVFGCIDQTKYVVKPISIKNYPLFYQSKEMDEYLQFLESNN